MNYARFVEAFWPIEVVVALFGGFQPVGEGTAPSSPNCIAASLA